MPPDRRELFVLGNGPSLRGIDFDDFSGKVTLGMNAAYRYWRRIDWRPTLYCCLDDALIDTHATSIKELIDEGRIQEFFLTAQILRRFPELTSDTRIRYLDEYVRHWHQVRGRSFGLNYIPHAAFKTETPNMLTTGAYSIRYAAMRGFEKIKLLGIDLEYTPLKQARSISGNLLRVETTPKENPNYFFADYQQAGDQFNIANPEGHGCDLHLNSFVSLRDDFVTNRIPVRLLNCAPTSRLHTEAVLPFEPFGVESANDHPSTFNLLKLRVKDADRLFALLWLWRQPAFFPMLGNPEQRSVNLDIQCVPESLKAVEKRVRRFMKQNPDVRRCFRTIEIHEKTDAPTELGEHTYAIDDGMIPMACDWLSQILSRSSGANPVVELQNGQSQSVNVLKHRSSQPGVVFLRSTDAQNNLLTLSGSDSKINLQTLLSPAHASHSRALAQCRRRRFYDCILVLFRRRWRR